MTPRAYWLAGLELGQRQFTAAVGQWSAVPAGKNGRSSGGRLLVQAVGSVPAQGISAEGISNAIEAADAVVRLMRGLERMLDIKLPIVATAVDNSQVQGINATASVPLKDPSIGIVQQDVERVIQTCRTLSLDYDRQILHAFQRGFTVDGQPRVKNPIGLYGRKLTAELHLVTALTGTVQNLTRTLNRAGLEVEGLFLPAVAAGEAVLCDLDRDLGVTLIRIGDFQTEAALYADGVIRETVLFPWGKQRLAEGLSRSLRIPRAAAVELLEKTRSLEENSAWNKQQIEAASGEIAHTFSHGDIARLLRGRVEGFLQQLQRRLAASPHFRDSASGVVMVGRLAGLEGFLEMAETRINLPVRLGAPRDLELGGDVRLTSAHTTAVGLLRCAAKVRLPQARPWPASWMGQWVERGRRLLEDYF